MKEFIASLESASSGACGILIGDLLITAGHVVKGNENITASFGKQQITLTNPLYCSFDNDASIPDLAIYRINGIDSPYSLAEELPNTGDILTSISLRSTTPNVSITHTVKGYSTPNSVETVICQAEVNNITEGLYFGAITKEQLREGSSGSPVISGDKVFGILCRGNGDLDVAEQDSHLCLFLSSKYIKQIIDGLSRV